MTGRNHISIDKVPQAVGNRNNIISSSLQMLGNTEPTDSRNKASTNKAFREKPPERNFHMRYVSQGMQRSSSIEGAGQHQKIQNNAKQGLVKNKQGTSSNEQLLVLHSKPINKERAPHQFVPSGVMEKRTIQQAS